MILFCDTSALVKLYIVEEGSDVLKQLVQETEAVAVHVSLHLERLVEIGMST